MLLAHTADLHLGSPLTARLSEDKRRIRRREVDRALHTVVEDATARGAEGILIVGDLFDSEHVLRRTVDGTLALIASYAPLPFFYVAGNHEGRTLSARGDLPDNLHVFGESFSTVTVGGVTVGGMSGALSAKVIADIRMPAHTYNVLLLHTAVAERTDSEHLRPSDLSSGGVDYVALGHYHTYTVYPAGDRTVAVYAGAPEGRGFDECGDRGYVLIDTDRRTHALVPTAKRRVLDLDADLSEASSAREAQRVIERVLSEANARPEDTVRVNATGRTDADVRRDVGRLSALFEGRFFHFELLDRTRARLDTAAYTFDRSLKGEFVRLVMADSTLSEQERETIIDCGLSHLQESVR